MKIVSFLYKLARTANTLASLRSAKTATKRVKNIMLAKLLTRLGLWTLWK